MRPFLWICRFGYLRFDRLTAQIIIIVIAHFPIFPQGGKLLSCDSLLTTCYYFTIYC